MNTAADSRVAVVTQLTFAVVAFRSLWMMPRIGTTRVCIIETTIAASPRTRTIPVCPEGLVDAACVSWDTEALT
ncbi:hypothetical protein GCM10010104_25070 [Streptomyces indiaensis]|uniref:Secreted protein n=1 Tax=Streptomyces indiaensis TaxID=284033 RepID=A0ABP5QEJ0_9ACTN